MHTLISWNLKKKIWNRKTNIKLHTQNREKRIFHCYDIGLMQNLFRVNNCGVWFIYIFFLLNVFLDW